MTLEILSRQALWAQITSLFDISIDEATAAAPLGDLGIDSLALGELLWFIEGLPGGSRLDENRLSLRSSLADLYDAYLESACRLDTN